MGKLKLPEIFEVSREDQDNASILPSDLEAGSLDDWFLHVEGKPRLYLMSF